MNSSELRKKFLDFFEKHGHKIVPSSSLLSKDLDNTMNTLFTTAGMQQFKPYYLSEKSPYGDNVASVQRCLRVSDIEEVGDERHLTFFEMLGNFSFGGYQKERAIKMAKEFLDSIDIKIDYVTVFEGDGKLPKDEETVEIWGNFGFSEEKGNLKFCGKEDNFWGPTGDEGPCGPTTEIYSDGIEIWNIVFNQYYQNKDKSLKNLDILGIDTGMGLERLAKVSQKVETVFETDMLKPIIEEIEKLIKEPKLALEKIKENKKSFRIIADHIKASVFLVSEGIEPSNKEQGYVLRKLIRRAITHSDILGLDPIGPFTIIVGEIQRIYKSVYPKIHQDINSPTHRDKISQIIRDEEIKSREALSSGRKEFERRWGKGFSGKDVFDLKTEQSVPLELTAEWAREKGDPLSPEIIQDYYERFNKHQELSRTASTGMFKGGLADASLETTKLHTAAHLMLAGLRKVLGDHVTQKGSNINAERLRFDFSHSEKMTGEQIKDVENFVNDIIKKDLPVSWEEMTLEKARELNAMGVFESKYGEKVKVYTIGAGDEIVSREICGGPHVERTGILGYFKIQKEESSSAGVRRIKAILE